MPLQYESLKAILLYLDPNMRILLANRLPSIQKTEKAVPFTLDSLSFGKMKFTINQTTYQLGIIRVYQRETQIPAKFHRENQQGGFAHDIDKYGFKTCSDSYPTSAGDVDLKADGWQDRVTDDGGDDTEERLRTELVAHERSLEFLNDQLAGAMMRYPGDNNEMLEGMIRDHRAELEKYDYRNNDLEPPFVGYTQLSVESPDGVKREWLGYTTKLYEFMKYLGSKVFGERRHTIQVKKLCLPLGSMILRLPVGLKIQARSLDTGDCNMSQIEPMLDPKSYPLDTLTIMDFVEYLEHKAIRGAQKLIISAFSEDNAWPTHLQFLQNPVVIVKYKSLSHPHTTIIEQIGKWLENGRFLGSQMLFGLNTELSAQNILQSARNQFQVLKITARSLTIPFANNNRSVLIISYDQAGPNFSRPPIVPEYYQMYWSLKIEVAQA